MDNLLAVATVFANGLAQIPVRPLIQFMAIAVGLVLILRLNLTLQSMERAAAMPRALQTEVLSLSKQVEQLRQEAAQTRRYTTIPFDRAAALSIYRDF